MLWLDRSSRRLRLVRALVELDAKSNTSRRASLLSMRALWLGRPAPRLGACQLLRSDTLCLGLLLLRVLRLLVAWICQKTLPLLGYGHYLPHRRSEGLLRLIYMLENLVLRVIFVATNRRRNREEAHHESTESSRERKRTRIDGADNVELDVRDLMETEAEHTDGLSRVDFLGFYDDVPTLNMLTDLELFLFNQRQRWFDLGRLHSWTRFELKISRRGRDPSSPTGSSASIEQDASNELGAIIRSLRAKNVSLSEKLAATQADVSDLESRVKRGSQLLADQRSRNDELRDSQSRANRELDRLASTLRERDNELRHLRRGRDVLRPRSPSSVTSDSAQLKRVITNLVEEVVEARWAAEQSLRSYCTPPEFPTRVQWMEDFQQRARHELVDKYGSENTVPRWLDTSGVATGCDSMVEGTILHLTGSNAIDAFDPDHAPYDQLDFVEKCMELDFAALATRHEALKCLPEPRISIPRHYIWTVAEYNLPVPLGKFGQPHWAGLAWEDFNPIRLWKDVDGGKVDRGDALWIRLAEDAVQLPFEFRSNAQRIVASEAHRFKPADWSRPVLPVGEDVAEVDVWYQCVHNALYLPLAIRRQYSYNQMTRTLYREWDAGDLGIYLILRSCGPENRSRKEKKVLAGQSSKWSSWSQQARGALVWADRNREVWQSKLEKDEKAGLSIEHTRPRRYCGSGEESDVFFHLLRCGFNSVRMVKPGGVYQYLERAEILEAKLQEFKERVLKVDTGLDHNAIMARAKCLMELEDQRIPTGNPLVRMRVKSTDPVAAEHLKVLEHTL
ncbi:hypothetical protein AURDEDRAFT_175255 [Auricularia subglabra TFB-10046 SS5]|nr:hypothetical protein AURDEDRAFT_175255 [Auricularia subglabra TFB-10046 SS5]